MNFSTTSRTKREVRFSTSFSLSLNMLSSIALLRYWSRRAICVYLILCRWAWSEYLTKSLCVPNRKPPSVTAAVSIHKVAKPRNRPIKYQSRARDSKIENKTEKWRMELCIGLCIRQLWSYLALKSIHHFLDIRFIYGFFPLGNDSQSEFSGSVRHKCKLTDRVLIWIFHRNSSLKMSTYVPYWPQKYAI